MAYGILEERKGKTRQFTVDEEDLYEEHFLPYGVTPRQYEKLLSICKKVHLKRGEVLIEKGRKFDAVYLVTSGSTSGMTHLNRRVTAASSKKGNRDKLSGGDAGAWIGELAFLELLGEEASTTKSSAASIISVDASTNSTNSTSTNSTSTNSTSTNNKTSTNDPVSISTSTGDANVNTNANDGTVNKSNNNNNNNNNNINKKGVSIPSGALTTTSIPVTAAASVQKSSSRHHDNKTNEGMVKTLATAAMNSIATNVVKSSNSEENEISDKTAAEDLNHNSNSNNCTKKRKTINRALLTYIASEDSTLIKWDFEELAELLSTSNELRLAVTRAMTAAVVNKVVNLYVSKQEGEQYDLIEHGDEEAHDDEPDMSMWKQWMVNASSKTADKIQKEEEEQEKKMRNVPGGHRRSSLRPGAVRLNVVKEDRD